MYALNSNVCCCQSSAKGLKGQLEDLTLVVESAKNDSEPRNQHDEEQTKVYDTVYQGLVLLSNGKMFQTCCDSNIQDSQNEYKMNSCPELFFNTKCKFQ